MNKLFDPNWTFCELVLNLEVIKPKIQGVISSFSCFEIKEQQEYIRGIRKTIYSYNFEVWQCDRVLECIYDDLEYEELKKIMEGANGKRTKKQNKISN